MVPPEVQILTVVLWLIVMKFCQMTTYPYLKPAVGTGTACPVSICNFRSVCLCLKKV